MKPPWQMPWPFSISARTAMDSSAEPGLTPTTRMPSACVATSRAYIDEATRCASECASSAPRSGWRSPTKLLPARGAPGDERRDTIALAAVVRAEMDERIADGPRADRIRPGERSARIVDALLHREVDRRRRRDALDDRV